MTEGQTQQWQPAKAWLRRAEPIHGRGPETKFNTKRVALNDLFDRAQFRFEAILGHPATPDVLSSAGRSFVAAYRADDHEVPPLGAAVAWSVMTDQPERKMWGPFIDELIGRYGAAFAAETIVIGAGLSCNGHPPTGEVRAWNWSVGFRERGDVANVWLNAPQRLARAAVAALPDREYATLVSSLGSNRGSMMSRDMTLSFLFPTQQDWVLEDLTAVADGALGDDTWLGFSILSSVMTVADAERVFALGDSRGEAVWSIGMDLDRVYSMCVNVGPGCEHLVAELFDGNLTADHKKRMAAILADFDTDAGQRELVSRLGVKYVEPAFLDAMTRAPGRAARLLAEASGTRAQELLGDCLQLHPELNPDGSAPRPTVTDTPVAVPLILAEPPWTRRVAYPEPVIVDVAEREQRLPTVTWERGERDEWLTVADENREEYLYPRRIPADPASIYLSGLAYGDEVAARGMLVNVVVPRYLYEAGRDARRIVARFEVDAADLVIRVATVCPATTAHALLPIDSSDVCDHMIGWLSAPSLRPLVYQWFERHIRSGAADLIVATVTATGASRTQLCTLLNELGRRGHRDVLLEAARHLGDEIAMAVDGILDIDPVMQLPNRIPVIPDWMDPALLPPVRLKDGSVLPVSAVGNILTMLAMSRTDDVYAGIDIVGELVVRDDLARLAWEIFERWCSADHPSRQAWVLDALGIVGTDDTVRRLTPFINSWPLQSGHRRAEKGLDVLSSIGTDAALTLLWTISQDVKYPALKRKAVTRIRQISDRLELSPAELADRTVPDFGLDASGSTRVDVGVASYAVGVDEKLRLVIVDSEGRRHAHVPKPSNSESAESQAAHKRYVDFRTDLKRVGPEVIGHFESAMLTGRTWTKRFAQDTLVAHPLMWQIVGRLVWTTEDERLFRFGQVLREPVDANGIPIEIVDDVAISIVHPITMGDDIALWQNAFDHEGIEQPFEQLNRSTFAGDPAAALTALENTKVPTKQLLALKPAGWVREEAQDKGAQIALLKRVEGRLLATMMVFLGFNISNANQWRQQKIVHAFINESLSPIAASELQRDLSTLKPRPLEPADTEFFLHP